jgi:hypothetical protein
MTDHRALAIGYFNAAWDLIDAAARTPAQDQEMLSIAMASRQHWVEAEDSAENLIVADWQVAHAASLAGLSDTALSFARSAVDRAADNDTDLPTWLKASVHEGMARAHACAGDAVGYEREAAVTRKLLDAVDDADDRELVAGQLASITAPG